MTFKRKEQKIYSAYELTAMNRKELNNAAISIGHIPAEMVNKTDLVQEILTAQSIFVSKIMEQRKEQDAAKEKEKAEYRAANAARRAGKNPSSEKLSTMTEVEVPPEAPKKALHSLDKLLEGKVPVDTDERVWFKVSAGEGKLGKAPLFAALNGESILVHRGKWVKLKKKFLNVLNDAIVTEVEQDREGEKTLRDVPRFNFQTRTLAEGHPVDTKQTSRSSF